MNPIAVSRRHNPRASALTAMALLAVLLIPAGHGRANEANGTIEARNEAIVREAFDKWRSGGNVFAELLSPDLVWTIHGSGPVAGTYRGIKDFVERAAAPVVSRLATPLVPNVHHIWSSGDRIIIRFDASATTTSGAPYSNQFVWIFRMDKGAVVEAEAFLDLAAYQRVVDNNEPRRP